VFNISAPFSLQSTGRPAVLQRVICYSHTEAGESQGTWWIPQKHFWAPWRYHEAWGRCHAQCPSFLREPGWILFCD